MCKHHRIATTKLPHSLTHSSFPLSPFSFLPLLPSLPHSVKMDHSDPGAGSKTKTGSCENCQLAGLSVLKFASNRRYFIPQCWSIMEPIGVRLSKWDLLHGDEGFKTSSPWSFHFSILKSVSSQVCLKSQVFHSAMLVNHGANFWSPEICYTGMRD